MVGDVSVPENLYMMCEVVAPVPPWWFDVVSYEYPDTLPEDPLDKVERLSSVSGWSL
jgi:hypothetical protein